MLTNLLLLIALVYIVAAVGAIAQVCINDDLPHWFDRATAYGDGKLDWAERLGLLIWLPAILLYVAWHDKWPGIKEYLPELWVAIALGRQPTTKDVL